MPTIPTSNLPTPKSWEELEIIIQDLSKRVWNLQIVHRNGRLGQKQGGVDIYFNFKGNLIGIQCKNVKTITLAALNKEIKKASDFEPTLSKFVITTSAKRDAKLQKEIRKLSQINLEKNKFEIDIIFWEDIELMLSDHEDLLSKHFPQFITKKHSINEIRKTILNSEPDGWEYNDIKGIYTFKDDVNLKIIHVEREELSKFTEPWLKTFWEGHGFREMFEVYYNNNLVDEKLFVAVDGFRGYIPLPRLAKYKLGDEKIDWSDLKISKEQYIFGKIINHFLPFHGLDFYLKRTKIHIE